MLENCEISLRSRRALICCCARLNSLDQRLDSPFKRLQLISFFSFLLLLKTPIRCNVVAFSIRPVLKYFFQLYRFHVLFRRLFELNWNVNSRSSSARNFSCCCLVGALSLAYSRRFVLVQDGERTCDVHMCSQRHHRRWGLGTTCCGGRAVCQQAQFLFFWRQAMM